MKISIDIDGSTLVVREPGKAPETHDMASPEAFALVSKLWLYSGWETKYVYGFSWMGRPIIQLPEDMIRIQELIYRLRPDVVLETGIAHGGSLVFYASLMQAMGHGRVIGVDIEIRPHNLEAITAHEMFPRITLVEGSSVAPTTLAHVEAAFGDASTSIVILDSNHSRQHVLEELRHYARFVSVGSYIVACDGIMQEVVGAKRTQPEWLTDNPQSAVRDFLAENDRFVLEEPAFPFNEGLGTQRVTYWPNAFLRRVS